MAMKLRKTVAVSAAATTVIVFVASLGLTWLSAGELPSADALGWPVLLSLGIGAFTAFQVLGRIKAGVLAAINPDITYLTIDRYSAPAGIDWKTLDDHAIFLKARGFEHLGDYTLYPPPDKFSCVACVFADPHRTTLVEVQEIRMLVEVPGAAAAGGVHFSLASVAGGRVRICTTDHTAMASNYLVRAPLDVVATFPGMALAELIEKHHRLVNYVQEKSGLKLSHGLTMERYVLLQRQGARDARARMSALSGFAIASQVDAFEAAPRASWSPSTAEMAAVEPVPLEELSAGDALPPVIDRPPAELAHAKAAGGPSTGFSDEAPPAPPPPRIDGETQARLDGSANWFYWIAGLSAVNAAVAAFGSEWGFVIGLGITQALTAMATGGGTAGLVQWIMAIGFIAWFWWLGRRARRPSTWAFAIGSVLFALDTFIFILAQDWVGVAFHALALYFLGSGWTLARKLSRR